VFSGQVSPSAVTHPATQPPLHQDGDEVGRTLYAV